MFLTYTVGPWLISAVQCCSDSWRQAKGSFISMLSWLLRKDKQERENCTPTLSHSSQKWHAFLLLMCYGTKPSMWPRLT